MPENNLGQIVQMLSALAGIQSQRRELDQRDQQYETSKQQFAQQMGFQEKSAEFKKAQDLLEQIAKNASAARSSVVELGQAANMPSGMVNALAHFAVSAPETVEAIRNRSASTGYNNPSATGPNAAMDREAAAGAASGMNTGGVANSGLQAILAGGAQGQVTPAMQGQYAQRSASNQTPLDALISATIAQNPDMRNRLASVTAGTGMTAAQQAGNEVASRQAVAAEGDVQARFAQIRQESMYHQMEIAEKLATAKAHGSMTPGMADMAGKMIEAAKAVVDPKSDETSRIQAKALYNRLAATIGWPDLQFRDPEAGGPAGLGARFQNSLAPFAVPNPPPSPITPNALQNFLPKPPQ